MKPLHFKNISILTNTMLQQGNEKEAEAILDKYLISVKLEKDAAIFSSSFYDRSGSLQKAIQVIDTAAVLFPADTTVLKQRNYIHRRLILSENKVTVDAALEAFRAKRYSEAVGYLDRLLIKYPTYADAREYRAFSHFFLNNYAKSLEDLKILIAEGARKANLYNLLGVNYYNLKNTEEACTNFKIAREMGDKDGMTNYNRFCGTVK
jgi:tetratricopeptide (TPR) repeat protein